MGRKFAMKCNGEVTWFATPTEAALAAAYAVRTFWLNETRVVYALADEKQPGFHSRFSQQGGSVKGRILVEKNQSGSASETDGRDRLCAGVEGQNKP